MTPWRLIAHGSVTRPHSSASSLRKPFKTPFKTPGERIDAIATAAHAHGPTQDQKHAVAPAPVQVVPTHEADEDEVEIVAVQMTPVSIPSDDGADDPRKRRLLSVPRAHA